VRLVRLGVGYVTGVHGKIIAAGGIALAVAIGVTGCGQVQKLTAKQEVSKALSGFEDAKAASFTLSLDTTKADLQAISSAQGEKKMSADDEKALETVLAGDIAFTVEAPEGKTLGEASKTSQQGSSLLDDPEAFAAALKDQGSFSATAHLSGADLVDLRFVNGVLYARADVKKIVELAGEDPSQVDRALSDLPPSLEPLAKAAKGEWVALDLTKAVKAAKDSGALDRLPKPSATPSVDAAKLQHFLDSLKAAYDKQATITEIGKDDARGQGYRVGAPAKRIAEAVSDDLIALVGQESESQIRKAITQIPDKTFYLDVWVKDDALTAVQIDLTQFLDKPVPGKKLAIDIAVNTKPAAITPPSGATEIDVQKLIRELPSALGSVPGLTSSGTATSAGAGLGSGSAIPSEKEMRKQLEARGLSDKQIDKILAGMPAGQ
jgi:hypothetical protein